MRVVELAESGVEYDRKDTLAHVVALDDENKAALPHGTGPARPPLQENPAGQDAHVMFDVGVAAAVM